MLVMPFDGGPLCCICSRVGDDAPAVPAWDTHEAPPSAPRHISHKQAGVTATTLTPPDFAPLSKMSTVLLVQARFADRDLSIESGYALSSLAALAHDRILLQGQESLRRGGGDRGTIFFGNTDGDQSPDAPKRR